MINLEDMCYPSDEWKKEYNKILDEIFKPIGINLFDLL